MQNCKSINTIIFFFLSFFLFLFYGMILFEMWGILFHIAFFVGLVLLFLGLSVEKQKLKHKKYVFIHKIKIVLITTIGALATFLLSQLNPGYGLLGPVVAASTVGLGYTLIASRFGDAKLAAPIYCGAFVGMSSPLVLPQFWLVGVAGLLSGLVYIASHEVYVGTGGTLGTIAFTSTLITRRVILKVISVLFGGQMFYETIVLLVSVVASLLTYGLNIKMKQGAVKASAIVGLLFGLPFYFLPALGVTLAIFETIPAVAIGASFAGMSSDKVITNRRWMTLVGAIFSGIFLFSSPVFTGNGGSLGASACVAVVITIGIKKLLDSLLCQKFS